MFFLYVFRANCDFIVNSFDFQGKADVTRVALKISNQRSTLAPQFFPLARPIDRIG